MLKNFRILIVGIVIGALLMGGAVFAKNGTEAIQAIYNNIKIYVDGVKLDPKDANGNAVEPFIYNGTTYLPVRAVGEAIGKTVTWDGATQSVYLGEKLGDVQYLMEVCPPYDSVKSTLYTAENGKSFLMGGKKYSNGFTVDNSYWTPGKVYFNLNAQYKTLTLDLGPVDGTGFTWSAPGGEQDTTVVGFYVDDKLIKEIKFKNGDLPESIDIPVNYGMKLMVTHCSRDGSVGFGNIIVK